MKWKVNGQWSDCMSEGVDSDFAVEEDRECVWIEGDALKDVFGIMCCGSGQCGSGRLMSKCMSWDSGVYGGVCCRDDHAG